MKRNILLLTILFISLINLPAQTHVSISDPSTWTAKELTGYIGQTIIFDDPMIICNNYGNLTIAPRRLYAPTHQALPSIQNNNSIISLNNSAQLTLRGVSGYHRMGERIEKLCVLVNSANDLTYKSGQFVGNTREELQKGPNMAVIDQRGKHTLLVCGMNLEYYLAYQFDPNSSMGPDNEAQHARQRSKTIAALSTINADLYGLVEIQQGDSALKEITQYLNKALPERKYNYIRSGTNASGSFTQSIFIYDSKKLEPVGARIDIDAVVQNRKRMQKFREIETDETFIYSINHYKAKSGSGTGDNADRGDGQSQFNADRRKESEAVYNRYTTYSKQAQEDDILIMGDLNAYGKEDPITYFLNHGMTDLHTYFHADSSYSYTFHGLAGYLDHAICNQTMLPQITGMMGYHINSDEDDGYTYDSYRGDLTMFRSSDHDPVLVGLKLDKTAEKPKVEINTLGILQNGEDIFIKNAKLDNTPAYYAIYTPSGTLVDKHEITDNVQTIERPRQPGLYIAVVYANGAAHQIKILVK